ncbi:MAG: hypothetical protein ACJ77W_03910 [Chloroflexota bacterium]
MTTSPGFAAEPVSGILVGTAEADSDGAAPSDDSADAAALGADDAAEADPAGDAELAADEHAATMIRRAASRAAERPVPLARRRPGGRLAADW